MGRASGLNSHLFLYHYTMLQGMCSIHKLAWVLVIVGALNWGLVGLFGFDLVDAILGQWEVIERIVYVLVGVSAVVVLFGGSCKACKK